MRMMCIRVRIRSGVVRRCCERWESPNDAQALVSFRFLEIVCGNCDDDGCACFAQKEH
jgi:hypothetical protein